jgi:bifunctional diaminopimelate decarboxylase / aspartate kinase
MTTSWVVLKFGGTSVSSAQNLQQIAQIIQSQVLDGKSVFVVHSALSGVSNLLERAIEESQHGAEQKALNAIVHQHQVLAKELNIDLPIDVESGLNELEQLLSGIHLIQECPPRIRALILAQGELLATWMTCSFLQQNDLTSGFEPKRIDARDILVSNADANEYRNYCQAQCQFEPDLRLAKQLSSKSKVLITQGFIAQTDYGDTVVLGRGGSDTAAAYFAAILQAQALEIWTDVPGIFSTNPNMSAQARRLRQVNYNEAQEIASQGAKVLHPCCIEPVQKHQIPTYVYATNSPSSGGTKIMDDSVVTGQAKAVVVRHHVALLTIRSLGMWRQVGYIASVFDALASLGLSIDLVATSQSSISLTLDPLSNLQNADFINQVCQQLASLGEVDLQPDCSVISIIGCGIGSQLTTITRAIECGPQTDIKLLSQSASELNISIVVDAEYAEQTAIAIHDQVIAKANNPQIFGRSWVQLNQAETHPKLAQQYWWSQYRDQLTTLCNEWRSAYVYHRATVQKAAHSLLNLEHCDRLFYAIKANSHPQVLQTLYAQGVGFECVSPNELKFIRNLFPDIEPQRILYTPNFAPIEDYQYGFKQGVIVTVDNLYVLQQWPEVFKHQSIMLRIDLGTGRGHHDHVNTGGNQSKFGIPMFEIALIQLLVGQTQANVIGLHCHSGSGIHDPSTWQRNAQLLCDMASTFEDVKYIDLGGGFGITDAETGACLDLAEVDRLLGEVKAQYPRYQFWLEPGRYLVAEAGVLVSQVTQLKGKGTHQYVGIATGMNSLIRPALYGAHHPIYNLTQIDQDNQILATVVGPICESGDKFGVDRALPATETGDILLIGNAGAYGATMSSNYNMRDPAREFCF